MINTSSSHQSILRQMPLPQFPKLSVPGATQQTVGIPLMPQIPQIPHNLLNTTNSINTINTTQTRPFIEIFPLTLVQQIGIPPVKKMKLNTTNSTNSINSANSTQQTQKIEAPKYSKLQTQEQTRLIPHSRGKYYHIIHIYSFLCIFRHVKDMTHSYKLYHIFNGQKKMIVQF